MLGDLFNETVILLLQYNASGAMGIVVNRPTDVPLDEVLADEDLAADRKRQEEMEVDRLERREHRRTILKLSIVVSRTGRSRPSWRKTAR